MSLLAEHSGAVARASRLLAVDVAERPWPSVARPAELAAVRAALAEQRSVVVVGEAGVGKTHLVDQVLAARVQADHVTRPFPRAVPDGGPLADPLAARELVTISGSSVGADAPLASMHPRLRALTATWADPATGARALGLVGRSGTSRGDQVRNRRGGPSGGDTARAIDALPGAAPASGPLLVRVEDAHLLDPASATTLAHLARQGQVQLVVTLRTAAASQSPWLALWKDGVADRVDIGVLTSAQVDALLTGALGGAMTLDTSNRIWAETQGNPFYVRELVRSELNEGALVEKDGIWVGLSGAAPGRRVIDVVRSDVSRLAPAVREALDLVALAEPVPVSRLVHLVGDGVLDQLAHEGLILLGHSARPEEGLSPTVRVAHPMYAEALRRLVPLDRRRRLYAAMRTARTTAGGLTRETPASLLRSVVWALECGVRETSGRLRDAMTIATALNRPDVTVQIGFVALDELPPQHPDRADVLLLRADAWRLLDQPARASRDLSDAAQLLGPPTDPAMRDRHARWTAVRADVDQYHGDDVEAALGAIDRLRTAVPEPGPDGLPLLEVARLVHLGRAGRFSECLEPSLALLDGAEHPSTELLRLANPMVFGLGQVGRFADAVRLAERSTRAASAQGQQVPWLAAEIEIAHFLVRLWAGEVEAAIELLHPDDASWSRLTASDSFGNLGRGLIAAAYGRWSDAQRELRAACARYAVCDPAGVFAYAVAAQAVAAAAVGDAAGARELLETSRRTPLRMSAVIESDVRLQVLDAMAWLRQPTLHSEAMLLARWCAERGLHRTELSALHRAILAGHLRGAAAPTDAAVLARMRELGARVDSARAAALIEHAAAVVAGDEQLVQMAARRLGQCGLWLPMVGQSSALTRREREIAGLAAGGLSSRAIAERLTVSVRTVDSHLSRVFTKLGLRSRQDLGAALRGQV